MFDHDCIIIRHTIRLSINTQATALLQATVLALYFSSGRVLKMRRPIPKEKQSFILGLDGVGDLYEVAEHNALRKSGSSTRVGQDGDLASRIEVCMLRMQGTIIRQHGRERNAVFMRLADQKHFLRKSVISQC